MEKWDYLEITLVFSRTGLRPLEAVIIKGKRQPPPGGARTRSQILDHYAKLGWIVVKSYSDVYTFKRTLKK